MTARVHSLLIALGLTVLSAGGVDAQRPEATTVRVLDQRGAPVAHAVLDLGGDARIADDSGRISITLSSDTAKVRVRRMGFAPFYGPIGRSVRGEVTVILEGTAQRLGAVTVETQRHETPLERTGFYDRVNRAQRSAVSAEFISPEELDAKAGMHLSDVFLGSRFIKVSHSLRGGSLSARAGCGVTVLLDGQPMRGAVSTISTGAPPDPLSSKTQAERSMRATSGSSASEKEGPVILEELVDLGSVAAIEIYASAASVPVELIKSSGFCAVVAIWTGSRR